MRKIKQIKLQYFLIVTILIGSTLNSFGQYVRTKGTQILDPKGKVLHLHGINLGNWLLWEGYLMMGDFNYQTHSQFYASIKNAFNGDDRKASEFEHQWRFHYVTEKAIQDLHTLGFNSVRVPFHYNMFLNTATNTLQDKGFQYFDSLITWCRTYNMYVLLDMHAAPGYQNPGGHCDNVNSNATQPRESVTFWDGNNISIAAKVWKYIASRYVNEPIVWGYDLINEPVPQDGREYELFPSLIEMRDSIRTVDTNHVIVAEGSWWGSDLHKLDWLDSEVQRLTGINSQWDKNLVYQTHHYSSDVSPLDERLARCNKLKVPLILGEYGENNTHIIRTFTDWCITNKVGYYVWSFKKMSHDKCLWTIPPNESYNKLKDVIKSSGSVSENLYDELIAFCKNNIVNGAQNILWHQDFYDAVSYNIVNKIKSNPNAYNTKQIEITNFSSFFTNALKDAELIQIFNINGEMLIELINAGQMFEFNTNNLSTGIYIINVFNHKKNMIFKGIKK